MTTIAAHVLRYEEGVPVFKSSADRDQYFSELGTLADGQHCYNQETEAVEVYNLADLAWYGAGGVSVSPAAQTAIESDGSEYDGQDHSYQPVAIDLPLAAAAGSNTQTNPKFLAPIMGNIIGDALTRTANYLGGLIGAYSITGVKGTSWPTGGIIGIVMDSVSDVDAAVLAVLDGSDPSGVTRARAAFGVAVNNNNAGTGVDYGVDLKDLGRGAAYAPAGIAFKIAKALLRSPNDVCVLELAGVPVDGVAGTGAGFAGPGSQCVDITNKNLYINANTKASPTWKLVTRAA